MSTISHGPSQVLPEKRNWGVRLLVTEMWAALSIAVMWIAVLFAAIFGPDFVSTSSGGNSTTIPSAIVVAIFAYLGTRVVARYGFGRPRDREH
jgi:F0F1-type ATP synthase assembly protein I